MHSITQDDLDVAARKLCRDGAMRDTLIRNVYAPFVYVWNYAASEARKMAEPRKWSRPRKTKGTTVRAAAKRSGTRPVSYERAWEFVSQMSPAPAMIMTALFYTGMRPIELFSVEPNEVSIKDRWMVIANTKTGEPRGIPIHEVLVPLFTALKDRGAEKLFLSQKGEPYPVFEDGGGQIKSAINGARRRLAKSGNPINDVSPYTARHTVSTQLVINNVHSHIKDQLLGHAPDDMSRHYTNLPRQPLIEAINTLPVIPEWRDAEWLNDPLVWQHKLIRMDKIKKDEW